MKRVFSVLSNSALLIGVLALFVIPLASGQLIGSYQSGALGESVSVEEEINSTSSIPYSVEMATEEFSPYISFDSHPMISSETYQNSITFTAFKKQQANYSNLLTVTNTSSWPLVVKALAGSVSGEMSKTRVWLTASEGQAAGMSLTTEAMDKKSTILKVGQTEGFNSGSVVVGGKVMRASVQDLQEVLLEKPLSTAIPAGERVYYNPIYFNSSTKASLEGTQSVVLNPGEQVRLSLVVAADDLKEETAQLVMPITLSVTGDL